MIKKAGFRDVSMPELFIYIYLEDCFKDVRLSVMFITAHISGGGLRQKWPHGGSSEERIGQIRGHQRKVCRRILFGGL